MSELEAFIDNLIRERMRQAGAYWCGLCGRDHLDTTDECPVPVRPNLLGIDEILD